MDQNEAKESACCAKGKCCGGKALAAIALLAIGGAGGYLCGRQCAIKDAPAAVSAPAAPATK